MAVPKPNVAGKPMFVLQAGHAKTISALAFSPDGKLFATASEDNSVRLFQTEGMVLRAVLLGHDDAVNALPSALMVSPVTGSSDETARIWNTKSGKMIRVRGHGEMVSGVAFSSDGRQIVTSTTTRPCGCSIGKPERSKDDQARGASRQTVAFQPTGRWWLR